MNYKVLAEEIRGLAHGDVDSEISLSQMTDQQVVEHIVSCPCCGEQCVSPEELHQIVTDAVDVEDFINRVNENQVAHDLTDDELNTVDTIIEAGFHTALDVIVQSRKIREGSEAHQKMARRVWNAIQDNVRLCTQRMEADRE